MTFSLDKCERDENGHWKAQTRDGKAVVIVCNNAPSNEPLVGYLADHPTPYTWDNGGHFLDVGKYSSCDLINPPRKQRVTVEIWQEPDGVLRANFPERVHHFREEHGYRLLKTLTTEIEVP